MELVNKRDMTDAAAFLDEFDVDPELIHDLAQAIADGRRPTEAKAAYMQRVIKSGSLT